jgi:ethanolamine ammonia-lyase large subunit
MTLATEISLVKTEIASSLGASLYTAKDLVYVAKAIEALANAETTTGSFSSVELTQ